jgi:hypothetical protein
VFLVAGFPSGSYPAMRRSNSSSSAPTRMRSGAAQRKRSVTRGTDRAARVLAALGITELDPPTPPAMATTLT